MGETTETTRPEGCHFSSFHSFLLSCRKTIQRTGPPKVLATVHVVCSIFRVQAGDALYRPVFKAPGMFAHDLPQHSWWVEKMAHTQAQPLTVPWLAALSSHPTWFRKFNQQHFYPLK